MIECAEETSRENGIVKENGNIYYSLSDGGCTIFLWFTIVSLMTKEKESTASACSEMCE